MRPPAKASAMYEAFHRYSPRKVGEFHRSFAIPRHAMCQGDSVDVLYRSDKNDPETFQPVKKPRDYIHEHDPGVCTYIPHGVNGSRRGAKKHEVPDWICGTDALVRLGDCLGFSFRDGDGDIVTAECKGDLPELYCTPNGKALIVVEDKRIVLAMMWGGSLSVESRGIVG